MMRRCSLSVPSFLVFCLFLSACTAQRIGRDFDAAFGGLAQEHMADLSGAEKRRALVRLRFSGEYVVVSASNWILHLGEEYTHVRVVEQFTDRGTDYAILACIRADGTLQNMLLMLPALDSGMAGYKLQGAPDKPFIIDVAQKPAQVMQAMDSPNSVRVWWLDNGLHGPKIVTMAESKPVNRKQRPTNHEKTTPVSTKAPVASTPQISLPPPLDPTATVRMGEPEGVAGQKALSPQTKPVLILDP